jgi:hypothetical protein
MVNCNEKCSGSSMNWQIEISTSYRFIYWNVVQCSDKMAKLSFRLQDSNDIAIAELPVM